MKGQDVLVILKLACRQGPWAYAELADELGMSASEVHASVKRCEESGLYNPRTREPIRTALLEFLVHGLRYVFPARPGPLERGLPTSYAAPPLNEKMRFDKRLAPVMPLEGGPASGPSIAPLYRCAPRAASSDERLYPLLALVDALRTGRARERALAAEALTVLLAP